MPPATNSVNGIAHKPGLFLHCLLGTYSNPTDKSWRSIGINTNLRVAIGTCIIVISTTSLATTKTTKCLCKWYWKRINTICTIRSPLWLCYAKSTPVFSTAATRCSNIHTWYRNIINCICFTGTSIVADARNCCKYIWKFEGKSYIWSTCIVSKSPLFYSTPRAI